MTGKPLNIAKPLTFIRLTVYLSFLFLFTTCKKEIPADEKSFSGIKYFTGGNNDKVNSIEKTADGGFICCGHITTKLFSLQGFLMKIDQKGQLEWYKTYEGFDNNNFLHAIQTSDGGYLAVGNTENDSFVSDYILKAKPNGDMEWRKNNLPARFSRIVLNNVVETPDHYYYATGTEQEATTGYNTILMKMDAGGNMVYRKMYTDFKNYPPYLFSKPFMEFGTNISIAIDGSVIIGGFLRTDNNGVDPTKIIRHLLSANPITGAVNFYYPYYAHLSETHYLSFKSKYETSLGVKVVNLNDGYLMATKMQTAKFKMLIQLFKTNLSGVIQWKKEYPCLGNSLFEDIHLLPDGSMILVGSSTSSEMNSLYPELFPNLKCTILKLDKEGNEQWVNYFGSAINANIIKSIQPLADGGWAVAGYYCSSTTGYDRVFWARLDKNGQLIED